jgi:hypothetical protein
MFQLENALILFKSGHFCMSFAY